MCHSSARPCSARVSSFLFLPLSCFLLPLLFSFVLALSREGLAFRLFFFFFLFLLFFGCHFALETNVPPRHCQKQSGL